MTRKPFLKITNAAGITRRMIDHVVATVPDGQSTWLGTEIENTIGQADTVMQMLDSIWDGGDHIITVLDCDTILDTSDILKAQSYVASGEYDAAVLVVESNDDNMSRCDSYPEPLSFYEKSHISQWGIVSCRVFSSSHMLRKRIHEVVGEYQLAGREPYMSAVLNRYPGRKRAVEAMHWTDWGTPSKIINSGAKIHGR